MIELDLLTHRLISVTAPNSVMPRMLTLPELYAALVRDEVLDFPALRPHQRHVWHAFLVQVGALALHRGGSSAVSDSSGDWHAILAALTPGDRNAGAWALVAPVDQPALLQPPIPDASSSTARTFRSPDVLDMLVTAKNHDVKRGQMYRATPEHWLFALMSLQTQEGVGGRDNYGISRMNAGFSSRAGFGIVPAGRVGRRVIRDMRLLLELRAQMLARGAHYKATGGTALLWLLPWDGTMSLSMEGLDPFYVEICRRVRLQRRPDSGLEARCWGSKVARIRSDALRGVTGDPWAPVVRDAKGPKSLTLDRATTSYHRLTPLLFPRANDPLAAEQAPLARVFASDDDGELSILVMGIVRGQGKTEGLHRRRIAISNTRRSFMAALATDPIAALAHERVRLAGEFVRKVFYPSVLTVYTAAPGEGERARDDDTAKNRAGTWCRTLESCIDARFFERLDEEAGATTPEEASALRREWLQELNGSGRQLLDDAMRAAPDAAMRHYRVRVRADDRFTRAFGKFLSDAGFEPPQWRRSIALTDDDSSGVADDQ